MEPTEPPDSRAQSPTNQCSWEDALVWLPDAVLATDRDGKILLVNRAFENCFGYRTADLLGKHIRVLVPEQSAVALNDLIAALLDADPAMPARAARDLRVVAKGGAMHQSKLCVSRIAGPGQMTRVLCCSFHGDSEATPVQGREAAVMRALAEIEGGASFLAHEIKNPITAVNMALRAVAKHLGEDEQAVLSDLVERMKRIEDLMRHTAAFAKPLELETTEFHLSRLVQSAVEQVRAEKDGGTDLEIAITGEESIIEGDFPRLRDTLLELLRNARDSTGSLGRIRLEANADTKEARIHVDDDGSGIPEHLRSTLFKPFVTSKASGTGLGLAIARKVIGAHSGTLESHSSPLGGARFVITLPVQS